jgi:heme A synthase
MSYTIVLTLHSWLRWIALALGAGSTFAAIGASDEASSARADRWGLFLMMALDIQMLLGLLLYLVLSPFTATALHDFGAAMRTPSLRFWAVEHAATMFVAVIVVHVGRVLVRKATTPESKRWRLAASVGFATFLMLLGTPWPGLPNGRPLFRF